MIQTTNPSLFGAPISTAIARSSFTTPSGFTIPAVLARLAQEIEMKGLDIEGIFRKPGSIVAINQMQAQLEENPQPFTINFPNLPVHAFTGLFKRYLQQLPVPVIPQDHQAMFLDIFDRDQYTEETIKRKLKDACKLLPHEHLHLLQYLIEFCHKIQEHRGKNQMNVKNLSIIFAPTCTGADATSLVFSSQSTPTSKMPSPASSIKSSAPSRKPLPLVLRKSLIMPQNARDFVMRLLKKNPKDKSILAKNQNPAVGLFQLQLIKDSNKWIHIFEFMMNHPEVFAAITNPLNSQKYKKPTLRNETPVAALKLEQAPVPASISIQGINLPARDDSDDEGHKKSTDAFSHLCVDFSILDYKEPVDFFKKFDELRPRYKKTKPMVDIKPLIQKFEIMS